MIVAYWSGALAEVKPRFQSHSGEQPSVASLSNPSSRIAYPVPRNPQIFTDGYVPFMWQIIIILLAPPLSFLAWVKTLYNAARIGRCPTCRSVLRNLVAD